MALCVTTETRHLDRLGQLGEFEQDNNTDSMALCAVQLNEGNLGRRPTLESPWCNYKGLPPGPPWSPCGVIIREPL